MSADQNTLRIRPRFKRELNLPQQEVKNKIMQALEENKDSWNGKIVDNHVIIKVPAAAQHYWSPQLTLELEATENATLMRGLFGPKPGVWTMFVFFYSSIGFLTLMGLIFGLSQMMLDMDPFGLWSVPVGGGLLVGLFVMSKIGQRLSHEQMKQLNDLLMNSFDQRDYAAN
jgi:hypothetical protein